MAPIIANIITEDLNLEAAVGIKNADEINPIRSKSYFSFFKEQKLLIPYLLDLKVFQL